MTHVILDWDAKPREMIIMWDGSGSFAQKNWRPSDVGTHTLAECRELLEKAGPGSEES